MKLEDNNRYVWKHKPGGICNVCLTGYPTKCTCGGHIHGEICFTEEDQKLLELLTQRDWDEDTEITQLVCDAPQTVLLQCDKCKYTEDLGPVSKEKEMELSWPICELVRHVLEDMK